MKRLLSRLSLVCATVVLASATAAAQQQGSVVGRVTERASGQNIADATVLIVNTQRGSRTGEDGRYRIANVPAGTYQVRVNRIGYAAVTQNVTVTTGDATLDFRLEPTAVTIDEVVVSATGTAERKRENGNDVGIIKPSNEVLAASQNFTQVLSARTPGLIASANSGSVGTSARIRIRGANSISLSNDPLLIVDGVRVDNNTN